jgi:hypothetical protein
MTQVSSQVTALVQPQKVGQVEVVKNVFDDAFAIYGSVDMLGTGNAVVRMFVYSASPQERDFTAKELTDGTFSTWAGSSASYSRVSKIYNQKGDSDLDLSHASSSLYHFYDPSTNEIRPDQAGYYTYTNLITQASGASSKIASAFEDNTIDSDTTFVLGARKKDSSLYGLPASGRTMFVLRDATSPVSAISAKHKAIAIKSATYSDDIGISIRGDDFVYEQNYHDTFDHSTLKTYIGEIQRQPVSGVISTDINMFVDGTQEIDVNSANVDNDIEIGRIEIGDNRYRFKCAALFNKILTTEERTEVHTRLSAHY